MSGKDLVSYSPALDSCLWKRFHSLRTGAALKNTKRLVSPSNCLPLAMRFKKTGWENSRQLRKPWTSSRVSIFISGETFPLLKYKQSTKTASQKERGQSFYDGTPMGPFGDGVPGKLCGRPNHSKVIRTGDQWLRQRLLWLSWWIGGWERRSLWSRRDYRLMNKNDDRYHPKKDWILQTHGFAPEKNW